MYENRQYLIIPTSEISKIDFNLVCETSADTLRKTIDETKTFIKWDGDTPAFISNIDNSEGPYTYEEIQDIFLNSTEWNSSQEQI
jgi:hypothetical protein